MDSPLSKEERRKKRLKPIITCSVVALVLGLLVWAVSSWLQPGVSEKSLRFTTAIQGDLEITLNASGTIIPASEEIIISPIATRILEVYKREGDVVEAGEQLMLLDMRAAENELSNYSDEHRLKEFELTQTHLANNTYLSNLKMQIKVKEMEVNRLRSQVESERRLDSIGSGTGEKVQEAELTYERSRLELEQLRSQLENEAVSRDATERMKEIEIAIHTKNGIDKARTVQEARIEAPRYSTITYLRNTLGEQIGKGEKLAVLADLSVFKIDASIADAYSGSLKPHSQAWVRIDGKQFSGTVTNITAQSKNGSLAFEVMPDSMINDKSIRPGVKADVFVVDRTINDAVLIEPGLIYRGPGEYELYVEGRDGLLHRRKVLLGDGNFNYVVVLSGIEPGERVVVSNLSEYKNNTLKIKH